MIRFKKVLCPVDFFPASQRAARYAGRIASDYEARLKLVHVISPIIPTAYELGFDATEITARMREASERELRELLKKNEFASANVESELRTGNVVPELRAAIAAYSPDLLVMGTHSAHGFERWFVGSTTRRLLHKSALPILTMAAQQTSPVKPFRRILVATDFSKGTAAALRYALSLAQKNDGAGVTLLHVLDETKAMVSPSYREQRSRAVKRDLLKLIPNAAKGISIDVAVDAGTPYFIILRALEKMKIDLVVMNTQGKGFLDRAILGSTSERVLGAARCPVLLIPPSGRGLA